MSWVVRVWTEFGGPEKEKRGVASRWDEVPARRTNDQREKERHRERERKGPA